MNKTYLPICLICLLVMASCSFKKQQVDGYSQTPEKLYYKLLSIGDGKKSPVSGDILQLEVNYKTLNDSIFWDSKNNSPSGYFLNYSKPTANGNYTDYISKMVEGDSASFLVNKTIFFKEVFGIETPVFLEKDTAIKVELKLLKILKENEYAQLNKSSSDEQAYTREQEQIQNFLANELKDSEPLPEGIYYQKIQSGQGPAIESGKNIILEYKGFFLDGRLADYTPEGKPFELIFGEKEQLIPGLQMAITYLKKDDVAKIILPSQLAFGQQGSTNGNIPPYTPLLYEVHIIDVK